MVDLGGIDVVVFTAGVGEHAASVRSALCQSLSWLVLDLDAAANRDNGPRIRHTNSRVSA